MDTPNSFTPVWFDTYLKTYAETLTGIELAFVQRQAPLPADRFPPPHRLRLGR